jgi:hypothetical protein
MSSRLSGKKILELLYKNSGMTWLELCEHFGARSSNYMPLYFCMQSVAEFGLVSVDGLDTAALPSYFQQCLSAFGDKKWKTIRVSEAWRKLEYTLHHKFDYSGNPYSDNSKASMQVSPMWGKPGRWGSQESEIFVLMPFRTELNPLFDDVLKPVACELGLSCMRADLMPSTNAIIFDVWSGLCAAKIVIADCTGRNPNVFYELGVAHTVGKPVVLLTQVVEDIPFDVLHIRYLKYDLTPEGKIAARESLMKTIGETLRSLPSNGNARET